jgi:hypothetical protein
MDATLSARGRGQAPKPRSGASKTPGLRSAAGRKIMGQAVPLRPRLMHQAALMIGAGIDTSTPDTDAGCGNEAWAASNCSGAR